MRKLCFLIVSLSVAIISTSVMAASPRTHYLLYCSGCHLVNGEGNHPNVPTLHDELGRMLTVPEMRDYLVQIPGAAQAPINDAELTAVINWVLEQWNSETLPDGYQEFSVEEVETARKQILADPLRYRVTHWKPYPE